MTCALSSFLFLIVAEIIAHRLQTYRNILDLKISENVFLPSFDDDRRTESNIRAVIKTLDEFYRAPLA